MYGWIKSVLLSALKVPHEPEAPAGSPGSIQVFRAGRRFYHWNLCYWAALQGFSLLGLVWIHLVTQRFSPAMPPWVRILAHLLEAFGAAGFLVQLPFTFWMQKLDYEMRWYIVTDRSLRIRSGIWVVQEITMTFANLQKIQLKQGPLQKLLGLATVEVSSAGGGAAVKERGQRPQRDQHAARFEGVDNASEIRDFVVERLRQFRDAGLGEKTELAPSAARDPELEASEQLLNAARGLRMAIERARGVRV